MFASPFHPMMSYISIHALHEESDYNSASCISAARISIHALHEESDSIALYHD